MSKPRRDLCRPQQRVKALFFDEQDRLVAVLGAMRRIAPVLEQAGDRRRPMLCPTPAQIVPHLKGADCHLAPGVRLDKAATCVKGVLKILQRPVGKSQDRSLDGHGYVVFSRT
jgi:hypothetical protein